MHHSRVAKHPKLSDIIQIIVLLFGLYILLHIILNYFYYYFNYFLFYKFQSPCYYTIIAIIRLIHIISSICPL